MAVNDIPGSEQFTHLVLTRFNVRNFYHKSEPSDYWLRQRMALFRRYCLPSFAGQSVNTFTWLVFFDAETPDWLRKEVEVASQGVFNAVYVPGEFTKTFLSDTVAHHCSTPFVITTRVDNDDAVAFDFVEQIQASFDNQELLFVNLVNGAQYSNGKTYLRPYTRNPFSSLIENITHQPPLTVFAEHHYKIDECAPVLNIRTSHPMWLQVVHGGNVLNEIVGLRVPGSQVNRYFPCAVDTRDTALSILADQMAGSLRILIRLLRRPHRLVELYASLLAQKAPQ
ncbi:glycosyltransferase [Pseudarthrobacter siccitolerans]|uniref:glycosyltransferase n=1 Tax=Pseudarthrobacter siccitolerans TaxID=861266 RepID=UPI0013791D5B|nr:glycosyltransferase [Pseudarthrobacter siccitolerans]